MKHVPRAAVSSTSNYDARQCKYNREWFAILTARPVGTRLARPQRQGAPASSYGSTCSTSWRTRCHTAFRRPGETTAETHGSSVVTGTFTMGAHSESNCGANPCRSCNYAEHLPRQSRPRGSPYLVGSRSNISDILGDILQSFRLVVALPRNLRPHVQGILILIASCLCVPSGLGEVIAGLVFSLLKTKRSWLHFFPSSTLYLNGWIITFHRPW